MWYYAIHGTELVYGAVRAAGAPDTDVRERDVRYRKRDDTYTISVRITSPVHFVPEMMRFGFDLCGTELAYHVQR